MAVGGEQEHTLQDYLTPCVIITTHIQLPNLGDQNCKLRHVLINMIERIQFHGLPSEDPIVHLRMFSRLIDTVKSLANAPDYIRLTTFPFSLRGRAEDWLSDLSSRSITTWDQCSLAFLMKFFPMAKSE
ncbi:hypothetical protein GYH30_005795 [Glycine max]|nr:hypothetical protein GYH30_005795 [Glycine max]